MMRLGLLLLVLTFIQDGMAGQLIPRMLLDAQQSYGGQSFTGVNGGGGVFHQGGPIVGPFPGGGPSGDPLKQQQNSLNSMSPGGSCIPLEDCACPSHAFRSPTGCYFCNCAVHQGPGQVLPTPLIISAGPSKVTTNNQTPPTPRTASPVTVAMAASSTTTAPSGSQCQSAARLCLLNCPGGYLVDPDDCIFCVCKTGTIAGRKRTLGA